MIVKKMFQRTDFGIFPQSVSQAEIFSWNIFYSRWNIILPAPLHQVCPHMMHHQFWKKLIMGHFMKTPKSQSFLSWSNSRVTVGCQFICPFVQAFFKHILLCIFCVSYACFHLTYLQFHFMDWNKQSLALF